MTNDATTAMCRCGIKERGKRNVVLASSLPISSPAPLPVFVSLLWGLTGRSYHPWPHMQCLPVKPSNTTSLQSGDSQQYGCRGDWIAEGTCISFSSRPVHHSSVKDNWWVKSPGSCRRVINGDRYTTWETGWEGEKIIYKRIVNSCTYC